MQPDHPTYREWLELDADGALRAGEKVRLKAHLEGCAECRREHRELAALARLVAASRVQTRPGFAGEVLAALPAAGWETRTRRSGALALACLLALGFAATLLLGWSATNLAPQLPALEAIAAVGDLLARSLAAGAGLIGASWRGVTLALESFLTGSIGNALAFGIGIACLDLLFWRLVRSRRPARESGEERARPSGSAR